MLKLLSKAASLAEELGDVNMCNCINTIAASIQIGTTELLNGHLFTFATALQIHENRNKVEKQIKEFEDKKLKSKLIQVPRAEA